MPDRPLGSPFVGRDDELRELLAGLDDAASGRGRLFLVGGAPGIGKSRLADELATAARQRSIPVLWGRCWEDAGAPAYWPWVQALRGHVRSADPDVVRAQVGAGAGEIVRMLPELMALYPSLGRPDGPQSDSARFQLFDSATTFLANVARTQGLVIVLDDLHAADAESILFLRFLGSQLFDTRLLVLGTYRDVEVGPGHPMRDATERLAREPSTRVMRLTGLPDSAVVEVIRSTSGVSPSPRLAVALSRETGGNPLFLGEAVRLLAAEGRLDHDVSGDMVRVTVPASIREVIARRLHKVGEPTSGVLSTAAVLGPEFSLEALRRTLDHDDDAIAESLEVAVRAELVARVTGSPGRFRFSHDLIRETLYEELSPAERGRAHATVGAALERLYDASVDGHLAELAHHFFEALQAPRPDGEPAELRSVPKLAADYARRAAVVATTSLAYEEAARLHRMTLQAVELDPSTDVLVVTEILLDLGDVQARSGDLEGGRSTFLDAAALARRLGLPNHLARAAIGYGGRFVWPRAGDDRLLVPLLQDALELLGEGDIPLRVRLLSRLACAWRDALAEHRNDSDRLSEEAVSLARASGDAATLAYALVGRFGAIWWPENAEERLAIAREFLALAEAGGDGERVIDAHTTLYMAYTELARMDEARAEAESLTRLARNLRQPAHLWLALATRASFALIEGDFALAAELTERERDPGSSSTPIHDDVSVSRMHRFLLSREVGGVAAEEASIRASVEEFPWYPVHRSALACLLLDLGRHEEARAIFEALARDDFHAFQPDNEWLLGICFAGEACSRLGQRRDAERLYEQLLPFAGRHAIGFAEGSLGAVDRYLGLLAASNGDLPAAEGHFVDGIRVNSRMGARPWTAHTKVDLAEMLLTRDAPGDPHRAAELLRDADASAGLLGMTVLERQIREQQRRLDRPEGPVPSKVRSGAFHREGEYWSVTFDDNSFRLQDGKGLRYLARLLAHPGDETHVLDLVASERSGSGEPLPAGSLPDDERSMGFGSAGEILDPEARSAYRERLRDLDAELTEADDWNDPERAERIRDERAALIDQLASAVGLGGRSRGFSSAPERARISVGKAIRSAMRRIEAQDSALGAHLAASVHTGTFCSYAPDPMLQLTWDL